jgi:protein-disulfide isomerase
MHNRAMAAAMAAEAAGKQGKFWEMHDKLFQDPRALTDENFDKYAEEIGLNKEQFKKDMTDKGLEEKIKKHQTQGATLGARGTPAFFVNGRFLSGAQPFEAFKKLIDEEKAKAEKILASGVARKDVYAKAIEKGLDKPK